MLRFLFPFTLFLSALLLFSIQPMAAKALLPVYGGTPTVWTVCMLFFQIILLLAYGYVWLLSQFRKPLVWRSVHCVLVALSLLAVPLLFHPLALEGAPEWSILCTLLLQLGLPLVVVGASAPLLQFAYSQTKGKQAADPYFLYAASNAGSLLALLFYPWVFERFIGLTQQFHWWSIGYGAYLALLFILLWGTRYQAPAVQAAVKTSWPWREMVYWIFLGFVPCSLMMGVTLYITTDIAATPLFWVLPLALYLLTFVLAFQKKPFISPAWIKRNTLFFILFTVIGFILGMNKVRAWEIILFNLASFFMVAMLCHGELFARRPQPQLLTLFYFCLSCGGVLAGLFNGLLAPHFFSQIYEYPLVILLSLLVAGGPADKLRDGVGGVIKKGWWVPLVVLGMLGLQFLLPSEVAGFNTFHVLALAVLVLVVATQLSKASIFCSLLILFVFIFNPVIQQQNNLLQERNFYGVKQVLNKDGVHVLISQSTLHGLQTANEPKPISGFTSYYGAIESVVTLLQKQHATMAVTIMGLGAGTMVCQHRETDKVQAIEIDPQMISLARNPALFTYLRDCPAQVDLIKNDGRLAIAQSPDVSQHLIVLDAFNSDAIPVHLMTLEAFKLYQQKLQKDGVILVNLSNRHVDLLPVLTAIGRSLDMMVFSLVHKGDPKLGQFDSAWALLTTNEPLGFNLMNDAGWRFAANDNELLWTDDYSNVVPLLRW